MSHESISFAREAASYNKLLDHQGSKERPTYSFNVDQSTGLYLSNLNEASVSVGGEDAMILNKSFIAFNKGIVLRDISNEFVYPNMLFKKINDDGLWWRSASGDVRLTLPPTITSVDAKLETAISSVESRADAKLETAIASVESRADTKLETAIASVESRADTKLETAIASVESRADTKLETAIASVESRADTKLETAITSVESRADTKLETAIASVESRADTKLETAIASVESRAAAKLETAITSVESRAAAKLETYANFINDNITITNDSIIVNKQLCVSDGDVCGSLYKKTNDHALYWNTSIGEMQLSNLQMYPMKSRVEPGDCVAITKDGVEKITCGIWDNCIQAKSVSNYKINKTDVNITISNDIHSICILGTYNTINMVYDESVNILVVVLVSTCVEIILLSNDLQIGYRSLTDLLPGTGKICLCLIPGQIVAIAYNNYKFFILLPSAYNSAFSQGDVYIDSCINCIDISYDVSSGLIVSVDDTISNNCCQLFDIIGMQLKLVHIKKLAVSSALELQLDKCDNYLLYYDTGVVIFKIIDNSIIISMMCTGTGKFTICNSQPSDFIGIVQYVHDERDACYVCLKGSVCNVDVLDCIGKKIYFGVNCSYDTTPINNSLLIGTCIGKGKILVGL